MRKIKINRNILWAETFVSELSSLGVKHACISPGSRSTPLTYAFASNKKIKCFPVIDERSSGFFALGLTKGAKNPVALVCTSGTAVAELYPAIIEAYQSKVPIIVCTADRPPELKNIGANQTINQENIYKNHIRWFADAGLPYVSKKGIEKIRSITQRAIIESSIKNIGPVHINFPFKEPFEPNSFTDEITQKVLGTAKRNSDFFKDLNRANKISPKQLSKVSADVNDYQKGIILIGFDNYSKGFFNACRLLSLKTGYPIFTDAASGMRFNVSTSKSVLTNYESYLRSKIFTSAHKPEYIIQFGRNFTSKTLSNFIGESKSKKLLVNQFGNWKNPKETSTSVIAVDPEIFCKKLIQLFKRKSVKRNEWLNDFIAIENHATIIKNKIFYQAKFPNETKIITEALSAIPDNSNLMISNSLPIRDLDLAASLMKKKINLFNNRGASGIDGIISTALGIAQSTSKKTFLITGDLAFYYDINSLLNASLYSIPLTIILINNNGGRIFEVLPISAYKKIFEKYFVTPHNLEFKKIVLALGGRHSEVKSWKAFKGLLSAESFDKTFSVIEIKTDPKKSLALRRKYFEKVISSYEIGSKD